MGKMDEVILAVDRETLFNHEGLTFQGILLSNELIDPIMERFNAWTALVRGDAEENPDFKQPIPYTIIKRGDEVFLYERLKAGGDKRLHNQLSIGVGGHMNPVDDIYNWEELLFINVYREIIEEVYIDREVLFDTPPKVFGLINDDSNEVGKVHIGILNVLEIPEDSDVSVLETDKLDGYWVRIQDLSKSPLFDRLENWSKIASGFVMDLLKKSNK